MTWTIYNNDKAWGFLSEVEKQALREHRGHSEMLGYPNGNWHTNDHTTPHDKFIYRAVPNPTPAVDADQTEQLDIANARIAELEAALDALRGRYRMYTSWPEMNFAGGTDAEVLKMADDALNPTMEEDP
jgi:hypothetical protein